MTRFEQITQLIAASGNEDLIRWWKQFTACATKMRAAQRTLGKSRSPSDKEKVMEFEKWFDDALQDHKGLFE